MAKLLLFSSASGLYSCPLAMTDGAAKIAEMHQEDNLHLKKAFTHLTSRNPIEFWTSGQWMTERQGGSDVAASTETIAKKEDEEDFYRLFGNKWFTSATDANIAFTLAHIVGKDGQLLQTLNAAVSNPHFLVPGARDFAFSIARIYICALLINHASSSEATESDIMTAFYWSRVNLTPFVDGINRCTYDQKYCKAEYDIVFNNLTPKTMEMMAKVEKKKNCK
ncbi:unnamed protein product [Acanthosepion pharaonis]|uniref:Uncharacterized protein n=1 Tax=Acanthosepion pharaonis TaxID=158019 RepID=A0A812C0L2_ACAPH|nr:unnamed protein product [Sepia pharaonis]